MLHAGGRRRRAGPRPALRRRALRRPDAPSGCSATWALLAAGLAAPEGRSRASRLLSAAERHQLAFEWNDTARRTLAGATLRRLRAPGRREPRSARPLQAADGALTYGELDAAGDRLARLLRALGVGPEARGGGLPAAPERLIAALLAVLKAGGAYLPLDPA